MVNRKAPGEPRSFQFIRRGNILSSRDAVIARAELGVPELGSGSRWTAHIDAFRRYEPAISLFAQEGWSASDVWLAVSGQVSPPATIQASGVVAIALGGFELAHRRDPPWSNPYFLDGAVTELGAALDREFHKLNVGF